MKKRTGLKLQYKAYSTTVLIIILILPIANFIPNNLFISDFSDTLKTQAEDSGEDSILWKLGKGLPGSGATMQPRLVNLTEGGTPLIVVGTDGGIATITLDGFINMSYRTFGPVIDFETIEDISGDNQDDIILITYYQENPNIIAISSNNGSEIWKFKPTIEGISTDTYQAQDFIPYSWDVKLINDITSDDIPEIVISSWHRLIVVNGKSGNKVWMNDRDFTNDVWKLEVVEDINGNGYETIIAGSEEGKLSAFNSQDGSKIWTFTVKGTEVPSYTMTGLSLVTIPNSIDDIKVIGDVNNDEIDDILIASDDGYLRLISGKYGSLLDYYVCYNISTSTSQSYYGSYPTSPYSSVKRIFMKSGIKIYETPDINNDGIKEYISIASDLDYSSYYSSENKIIQGKIFNPLSEINKINITHNLNWTYSSFFLSSYPEIIKVDSDIYYYSYEYTGYGSSTTALINRYHIDDEKSEDPEVVYTDPGQYEGASLYSESKKGHYFLNVGDLNSDGVDDLFAITANGRYLCIDCKNNDILWVRTQEASEIELTETNDLNDDGFNDFLIMQKSDFEPDWISSDEYETLSQTTEQPTIIVELYTIDAKTGKIIWSLDIPLPEYYKGLRDLKNMGDITGDDIDDYGAWIIPSTIPSDISEIIKNLIGNGTIDSSKAETIYRSFLTKYTKILAIDGSDGNIIWNTPMIDFPYKFYRQYGYSGTYIEPVKIFSSGKHIYNRINGEIDDTWVTNFDIQWENEWNSSSLTQASSIVPINGTSSDFLSDLLDDEGNYTINAEYVDSSWRAIMDLTIPVNLLDDNLLGAMDYPRSQIERLSALKMQTSLMVNTSSSSWYNFTYEIFDVSNNKWVLCNWSSETTTWNNHTYQDLKGDFESTRDGFNDFPLDNIAFQDDKMWVITRGTYDADNFIEFDYENKTTLSNFVDINKNIQIRLNITNGQNEFNLTINDFGIAAFYWGLFNNEYDRYYIWSGDDFDVSNLLNLEIQDFEVVNGNNDQYLDLITVIGFESEDTPNTWSTRIRLFDLKNNKAYTKWSLNRTLIPYQNVRVIPLNNSLNNWLLTGIFQFGSNFNCSHKLISDPHWDSQISHFESYSDSNVLISYSWEEIPNFPTEASYSFTPYEFPGKTNITKDGKIGIIIGEYGYLESEWEGGGSTLSLISIRIIDINNRSTACKIPTENLRSAISSMESNIGKIDFGLEGAGYLLLMSHEDFNGDDFLDHIGIYFIYEYSEYDYMYGMECKIFSGNSGDSNPDILFKEYFADTSINDDVYISDKHKMPFTSIGDINNDGTSEAIIGIQSDISYGSACKHSYINFYDIFNSNENEPIELTNYKWVLEAASCLNPYYTDYNYEFVLNVEKIEDINGDGYNEIFIEHDYYRKTAGQYGFEEYEKIPTSEIMDIFNQTILYRFNMDLNSIFPIVDLNEDGSKELLIASEELVYCINSKFNIQIINPKNRESMISNNFNIEWETDSQYDYFEVLINGVSQGSTTAKNIQVSLSSGWKDISVIMTDKSGLILSVNTIKVLVPSNHIHLILTFVFIGALVGVYIYYRRYSKKQKELILIDKKISEGGKK